jgi:hypothetical protein
VKLPPTSFAGALCARPNGRAFSRQELVSNPIFSPPNSIGSKQPVGVSCSSESLEVKSTYRAKNLRLFRHGVRFFSSRASRRPQKPPIVKSWAGALFPVDRASDHFKVLPTGGPHVGISNRPVYCSYCLPLPSGMAATSGKQGAPGKNAEASRGRSSMGCEKRSMAR